MMSDDVMTEVIGWMCVGWLLFVLWLATRP